MAVEDRVGADVDVPVRPAARGGGWPAVTAHWFVRYRRMWFGTAVSSFLAPLLYLVGMGWGLGRLVDDGAGGAGGVPYLLFVAPGVLAATALQVAAGETTFSVMGSIKWDRTYHGMLSTPLAPVDVVVGHLVFVLVRIALAASVFLAVAAALGTVRSWWGVLAAPVAVLGGMAFAAWCYAYTARLESDRGITVLLRFVVMPLSLFSGTFFPVDQLPVWLQPVAWATPLWHTVEVCRALTLGVVEPWAVVGHLAFVALWLVAGVVAAVRVLTRRMVV
ncbi:ABC transporter permease [Actinotalea sp. AC32]|nr:ABC transporter permease [Actinotalea sp. AC32]